MHFSERRLCKLHNTDLRLQRRHLKGQNAGYVLHHFPCDAGTFVEFCKPLATWRNSAKVPAPPLHLKLVNDHLQEFSRVVEIYRTDAAASVDNEHKIDNVRTAICVRM